MKKLHNNSHGFHVVEVVIAVVVLGVVGFIGWRVFAKKDSQKTQSPLEVTDQPASETTNTSEELLWQQSEGGWKAVQTPPACPDPFNLKTPVPLDGVTAILYPGQTRGGNYKPHGGFRLDGVANDKVTVTAPLDGFIVRGGRYLAAGEVQYTFDIMNNCGIMYRLGHFRALPDNLQKIADTWPEPQENDSRTESVNPPVLVKQGDVLATSVGIVKDKNTFFDWGVYDYRSENEASRNASFQQKHPSKELEWHAVCWFDLLSAADEAKVRSLPAGDPTSGKTSDYCK